MTRLSSSRRGWRQYVLLIVSLLSVLRNSPVRGEFGVPRSGGGGVEAEVDMQGGASSSSDEPLTTMSEYAQKVVAKLLETKSDLNVQVAIDIATLVEAAKRDPETVLLLRRMTEGTGKDSYQEYTSDMNPDQILHGMAQTLQDLKLLDVLFRDPERAMKEMEKDGMIPKDKRSAYKKNPELLEEDTRKSLYFTFVSLASAGGYL